MANAKVPATLPSEGVLADAIGLATMLNLIINATAEASDGSVAMPVKVAIRAQVPIVRHGALVEALGAQYDYEDAVALVDLHARHGAVNDQSGLVSRLVVEMAKTPGHPSLMSLVGGLLARGESTLSRCFTEIPRLDEACSRNGSEMSKMLVAAVGRNSGAEDDTLIRSLMEILLIGPDDGIREPQSVWASTIVDRVDSMGRKLKTKASPEEYLDVALAFLEGRSPAQIDEWGNPVSDWLKVLEAAGAGILGYELLFAAVRNGVLQLDPEDLGNALDRVREPPPMTSRYAIGEYLLPNHPDLAGLDDRQDSCIKWRRTRSRLFDLVVQTLEYDDSALTPEQAHVWITECDEYLYSGVPSLVRAACRAGLVHDPRHREWLVRLVGRLLTPSPQESFHNGTTLLVAAEIASVLIDEGVVVIDDPIVETWIERLRHHYASVPLYLTLVRHRAESPNVVNRESADRWFHSLEGNPSSVGMVRSVYADLVMEALHADLIDWDTAKKRVRNVMWRVPVNTARRSDNRRRDVDENMEFDAFDAFARSERADPTVVMVRKLLADESREISLEDLSEWCDLVAGSNPVVAMELMWCGEDRGLSLGPEVRDRLLRACVTGSSPWGAATNLSTLFEACRERFLAAGGGCSVTADEFWLQVLEGTTSRVESMGALTLAELGDFGDRFSTTMA